MSFDVYYPFKNKEGKVCPGIKALPLPWSGILSVMERKDVSSVISKVREGHKECKVELPAVCWTGRLVKGTRSSANAVPTQFVMIDIDHCKDAVGSIKEIIANIEKDEQLKSIVGLIHLTPSLGIRIVFRAVEDYPTISDHMAWFGEKLSLGKYGDFDAVCHDIARISFLVRKQDILYCNEAIMNGSVEFDNDPIKADVFQGDESKLNVKTTKKSEGSLFDNTSVKEFTDEEKQKFEELDYRGTAVKIIVEKYVEVMGKPSSGEIHNYYNEMVKNFRCITSNDKRALLYLLPRFGHTMDECWSQIVSITRVNTLSRLPKSFYFFLKDNGFYEPRGKDTDDVKAFMMDEKEEKVDRPPFLPPVFKQLVGKAPIDYVVPAINALLPILGTLTSYLKAVYPYDSREHTTSFFSIIYAPPSTGKGFVERFIDLLFEDLKVRDFVQSTREAIYLRILNKKGDNEKSPDMPHVSLRIIPPKNSEAEFLQKQSDNHGYHMFTYAAEMDSWAKGVRAAGGNKDDMIRVAWDNGEYGQQFKSPNTFKGIVRLYWNVLITGTIAQVESYFKNVENGLVTRCSFCSIDNQEFSMPAIWNKLSKKDMEVIKNFMKRCDERSYTSPCEIDIEELATINDDDFDNEVDWKFKFRPKRFVDLSWIMPTIEKFHKEQMAQAALDVDRARDVFRRRVGVRGFRLALLCVGLWENPRKTDLEKCATFIDWWMHKDLDNMLKLWGSKYNEQTDVATVVSQRSVFNALDPEFSRNDVYLVCVKQGIKTPVRRIIFDWNKLGYITQIDKEHYKKKQHV